MRTFSVHVLEGVYGIDLTVSCQTYGAGGSPDRLGGHTYTRTLAWQDTDDSWDEVLRMVAEELFNVAHDHEHC